MGCNEKYYRCREHFQTIIMNILETSMNKKKFVALTRHQLQRARFSVNKTKLT